MWVAEARGLHESLPRVSSVALYLSLGASFVLAWLSNALGNSFGRFGRGSEPVITERHGQSDEIPRAPLSFLHRRCHNGSPRSMDTLYACQTKGKTSGQDSSSQAVWRDWHGQQSGLWTSNLRRWVVGSGWVFSRRGTLGVGSQRSAIRQSRTRCSISDRRDMLIRCSPFLLGYKVNLQKLDRPC